VETNEHNGVEQLLVIKIIKSEIYFQHKKE